MCTLKGTATLRYATLPYRVAAGQATSRTGTG